MASASRVDKVVYEKDGVFVHTCTKKNNDQDSLIPGILRLIEKPSNSQGRPGAPGFQGTDAFIDWVPVDENGDQLHLLCPKKDSNAVVDWKQQPTGAAAAGVSVSGRPVRADDVDPGYEPDWAVVNTVGYKKRIGSESEETGVSFQSNTRKSKWAFAFSLSDLKSIRKNKPGLGWSYLIFIIRDGTSFPALHFHQGGSKALLTALSRYVSLTRSPLDSRLTLVHCHDTRALSQSMDELQLFDDGAPHFVSKFIKDPYTTTLGSFSKVTNFLRESLAQPHEAPRHRPPNEIADLLNESIPGLNINQQEEPGFELITCTELGPRPNVQRREPVSTEEWERYMDPEGRVRDVDKLKAAICQGGLAHSLRKEVWKFVLGYYPWTSTTEERKAVVKKKADEYFRMKLQWKSVSEEQEKRNSNLRDYKNLIEKDVNRTDRTNKFYEGSNNPGLTLLNDILMTYCMYDFDLGYVQGMSDLLSPILYVQENEVDAFWCFVGYMDQVHHNFEESQQGMKTQLVQLCQLLHLLDPSFCDYLETHDSGNLYFCFRWLLIRFKREFSFQDILRLWEVMWTGLPCQNFHLLLCCAILDIERQHMMDAKCGFNEILKHVNELSMKLDVEEILKRGQAIYLQLSQCKELPRSILEILGMGEETVGAGTPESDSNSSSSSTSSGGGGGGSSSSHSSGGGSSPSGVGESHSPARGSRAESSVASMADSSIEIVQDDEGGN
ncbi:TBC1 domain family member 15 isoform X1 [Lethenteron reissneri]|uniref:TBC1 domain family member 15 isoform X1 n=1 Tax=Lethenteron reissneri TaxID=7753 RepID=UPI002AB74913|nr:TBC1 domain family member 15 isoform X1 [Lethenteron reissneri]